MNILKSGIRLLRETKETLVAVNRAVTSIDPFYVRITWAGSAINSLQQLGLYTLFGGLVGHVVEKVTIDWITVAVGISIYLIYRFTETATTAILALRKRRFRFSAVRSTRRANARKADLTRSRSVARSVIHRIAAYGAKSRPLGCRGVMAEAARACRVCRGARYWITGAPGSRSNHRRSRRFNCRADDLAGLVDRSKATRTRRG